MIQLTTKMAILISVAMLLTISSCYKKMDCINRRVCVMFYKGTDTSIYCNEFVNDTSKFGKVPAVVNFGYDYIIIYDSTYSFTVKYKNRNRDDNYSDYNSLCTPE